MPSAPYPTGFGRARGIVKGTEAEEVVRPSHPRRFPLPEKPNRRPRSFGFVRKAHPNHIVDSAGPPLDEPPTYSRLAPPAARTAGPETRGVCLPVGPRGGIAIRQWSHRSTTPELAALASRIPAHRHSSRGPGAISQRARPERHRPTARAANLGRNRGRAQPGLGGGELGASKFKGFNPRSPRCRGRRFPASARWAIALAG